ncbi:MAG: D-cysteine desulfhydrase family protein [Planctomycetota bacterium]|nr:MAG: D-cysteine desulfhydrase family protein [Planctomycetota bacterium]
MHPNEPERIKLAQLPTPIITLNNLSRQLNFERLLMKRDDLTGFEVSGNKVRKLEYIVADALANDADTLVTHGGFQSNHCRTTAAIGARVGLRVRLLLRCHDLNVPNDGNLFLDRVFGAKVSLHDPDQYEHSLQKIINSAMDAERAAGHTPYFFPVGASVPLGCWGYIRCMAELVEELGRDNCVDLFCATGSVGTQTGLIIGKTLLNCDKWRIVGVPITDSAKGREKAVRELLRRTIPKYQLEVDEAEVPIELLDGFIGEGYGIPYPEAIETIRLVAQTEGILLDPTYTSKAMTAMISVVKAGGIRKGAIPIFLHTGGAFGLMARRDLFQFHT